MATATKILEAAEKVYEQVFTGEVLFNRDSPYDDYNKDYVVSARVYEGCKYPNVPPALVRNCCDAADAKAVFYHKRNIDPTVLYTDVQRYKPVVSDKPVTSTKAKLSERIAEAN